MNTAFKRMRWLLMWSATAGIALGGIAAAQEAPPSAASPGSDAAPVPHTPKTPSHSAQIDAGEPRANTSPAAADTGASRAPANATQVTVAPAAAPAPPPERTTARSAASSRPPGAPGQKAPGATDRLELNTATVTGDREQPKVMYIVPWKKSDIGDLSGKPMNSLLDEALAPVDRDEFKREVAYYDAVRADGSQNGASNPAKQVEK
jgi:hypothetical protein